MKILVTGAGGFIGGHLVRRLLDDGDEVVAVDIKPAEYWHQWHRDARNLERLDLRLMPDVSKCIDVYDEVYNLAANMGGMGFIETHKVSCMQSVLINTNLLWELSQHCERYFFASSACAYPVDIQTTEDDVQLKECMAYPANPEDGYGWEKLFSERMCRHYNEEYGITTRVARYHNVYGPHGTWRGGREKAPAAMCRKALEARESNVFEIWGDGKQRRSFMYVDDCIEGTLRIMRGSTPEPLNLGVDKGITIQGLAEMACDLAGVTQPVFHYKHNAPQGVRSRNSDNTKIKELLGWAPSIDLQSGLTSTFDWIENEFLGCDYD